MRSFVFSILVLSATALPAAPMARVTGVKDARTLIIEGAGLPREVKLADVVIPPGEEAMAIAFLRDKLVMRYVMIETGARGESYVYRSPDSLFVNGEVARRAYLVQGTRMTIIGESAPGPERATRGAPAKDANALLPPAKPHAVRHHPSGSHRIPRF
jgi:hypothetical protein